MVKLQLSINAELENVTDLVPASDDFKFFFQVKCNSCAEVHPKFVSLDRQEVQTLPGGKGGTAHFVWKCSFCKREHSAKFDTSVPPQPHTVDSGLDQYSPLVILDCRGLEFVDFDPRGMWKCKGTESGTVFSEVDLSEGEWVDYDEKAKAPVSVMNLTSKWTRAS